MTILVTGCAGFIGSHLCERLLREGHRVVGIDNLDPFYAGNLKRENLDAVEAAGAESQWDWVEGDITDPVTYTKAEFLLGGSPEAMIHLAAKAGVRPSIADPVGYQKANVEGTQYMLEFARKHAVRQFLFASSSSVYGINPKRPWSESDPELQPISPYASTKLSCEFLGHVYSKLFGIRFLALRFFTVYGPRQRPDLAIRKFMEKIENGETIPVFGDGSTSRDYTYVEDTVDGILRALAYEQSDFEVFNFGNDAPVSLSEMIATLEEVMGKKAQIDRQGDQPGDVPHTLADISKGRELLGYAPETAFGEGVAKMYAWYRAAEGAEGEVKRGRRLSGGSGRRR